MIFINNFTRIAKNIFLNCTVECIAEYDFVFQISKYNLADFLNKR